VTIEQIQNISTFFTNDINYTRNKTPMNIRTKNVSIADSTQQHM